MIERHPLISSIEIEEAFGFEDLSAVRKFIEPLIASNDIQIEDVERGWFIRWQR